ncbi:MAG: cytidylate kinase family protein [Desulfopila sp.]
MAIITIARTAFSSGEKIARDVADKLGYSCLDRKELIHRASETFSLPETKLAETLDEPPKLWQQDRDKRDAHFNLIRATFLTLCREKKNLVYHGFSGQELIRGVAHVLRVLIIADEDFRLDQAMQELSVPREEAYEVLHQQDNRIKKWSRHMYNFEWNEPSLYDLVFHIGRIRPETAVQSIIDLVNSGDFAETEQSLETFANEFLASMVWSALTQHKRTNDANVIIMAHRGVVTIAGTVRTAAMAKDLDEVALKVEGVSEVINQVNIGTIWRS